MERRAHGAHRVERFAQGGFDRSVLFGREPEPDLPGEEVRFDREAFACRPRQAERPGDDAEVADENAVPPKPDEARQVEPVGTEVGTASRRPPESECPLAGTAREPGDAAPRRHVPLRRSHANREAVGQLGRDRTALQPTQSADEAVPHDPRAHVDPVDSHGDAVAGQREARQARAKRESKAHALELRPEAALRRLGDDPGADLRLERRLGDGEETSQRRARKEGAEREDEDATRAGHPEPRLYREAASERTLDFGRRGCS